MLNIDNVNFKERVPYVAMINGAKTAVDNICADGDYNLVGAEYLYYLHLFVTFSDMSASYISDNIDDFMSAVYNGDILKKLREHTNAVEVSAFERAVRLGVSHRFDRPAIDKLIDSFIPIIDGIKKIVDKFDGEDISTVLKGIIGNDEDVKKFVNDIADAFKAEAERTKRE